MRFCANHLVFCLGPLIVLATAAMPQAQEHATGKDDAGKSKGEMLLATMRTRAEQFTVEQMVNDKTEEVPLSADPVFRYSDQPRGLLDATLWRWGKKGRPIVLLTVEAGESDTRAYWQYCVVSLADHPVEVKFSARSKLVVKKAGVELHALEKAPAPADRPAVRLRQMKLMAKRFAGTIIPERADLKQEMRRLPTPICRYDDEADGLRDGVIFGLTTNGTNPDMLIVIELRGKGGEAPKWHYGIVKVTHSGVHIRLDDTEIYSSAITAPKETWTFFQTSRRR